MFNTAALWGATAWEQSNYMRLELLHISVWGQSNRRSLTQPGLNYTFLCCDWFYIKCAAMRAIYKWTVQLFHPFMCFFHHSWNVFSSCFTVVVWCVQEGYQQFRILQFPYFCVVEYANIQRSGFCQTHLRVESKCEQTQKRPLLRFSGCWREGGCEWQLQALCGEDLGLDFGLSCCSADGSDLTRCAPSQASSCLRCRQRRNWECLGHSVESRWDRSHSISEHHCGGKWDGVSTAWDWSGWRCGWMSYDALAGSPVSGLWKQSSNPRPLILHLPFRVHKSFEI